jgi:holo-[acyl-carrier protein] synthase
VSIVGVGVDIVSISRFQAALDRTPRLAERLFTDNERALPVASLAATFAAKEAVAKALGAPRGLQWHDVDVRRGEDGRPALAVLGTVAAAAAQQRIERWHLSLSHDADVAVAFVVAEN